MVPSDLTTIYINVEMNFLEFQASLLWTCLLTLQGEPYLPDCMLNINSHSDLNQSLGNINTVYSVI